MYQLICGLYGLTIKRGIALGCKESRIKAREVTVSSKVEDLLSKMTG